jgi:hypothetical protein
MNHGFHFSYLTKYNKIFTSYVTQFNYNAILSKFKIGNNCVKTYHEIKLKNLFKSNLFTINELILAFYFNISTNKPKKKTMDNKTKESSNYNIGFKINLN